MIVAQNRVMAEDVVRMVQFWICFEDRVNRVSSKIGE